MLVHWPRCKLCHSDSIAPKDRAMRCMLHVCEFSREFCVTFNAAKSACVVVSIKPERYSESMEFSINGKKIVFSDEYVHLGHIITRNMDDQKELISKRNSRCGKINDVLCFSRMCRHRLKLI